MEKSNTSRKVYSSSSSAGVAYGGFRMNSALDESCAKIDYHFMHDNYQRFQVSTLIASSSNFHRLRGLNVKLCFAALVMSNNFSATTKMGVCSMRKHLTVFIIQKVLFTLIRFHHSDVSVQFSQNVSLNNTHIVVSYAFSHR